MSRAPVPTYRGPRPSIGPLLTPAKQLTKYLRELEDSNRELLGALEAIATLSGDSTFSTLVSINEAARAAIDKAVSLDTVNQRPT